MLHSMYIIVTMYDIDTSNHALKVSFFNLIYSF